MGSGDVLH